MFACFVVFWFVTWGAARPIKEVSLTVAIACVVVLCRVLVLDLVCQLGFVNILTHYLISHLYACSLYVYSLL